MMKSFSCVSGCLINPCFETRFNSRPPNLRLGALVEGLLSCLRLSAKAGHHSIVELTLIMFAAAKEADFKVSIP